MVKVFGGNNFDEVIKSGVVVVDFYADWCGPCKMLAPVMEELSDEMDGKATFLKVKVDDNQRLAQEYGITNIPSVIFFKDGEKKEMQVGFIPKNVLEQKIKSYL